MTPVRYSLAPGINAGVVCLISVHGSDTGGPTVEVRAGAVLLLRLRLRLRCESLGSRGHSLSAASARTQVYIPWVPRVISGVCRFLAHHPCSAA